MTEQDRETHAAIEALAHRIRVRDAAMAAGEDYEDAEPFAAQFMAALRGRGWRLTAAKVTPAWTHPVGPGTKPPAGLLEQLRADLGAKAEQAAAERHRDDAA